MDFRLLIENIKECGKHVMEQDRIFSVLESEMEILENASEPIETAEEPHLWAGRRKL